MLARVRHILEMIRFSHTLFALPFALFAAVMPWTAGARSEPPVAWRDGKTASWIGEVGQTAVKVIASGILTRLKQEPNGPGVILRSGEMLK